MLSPIVLYGAGDLGTWVVKQLKEAGIAVAALIDRNPNLWGTQIHGVNVLSPTHARLRYGENAQVFVTTKNGPDGTKSLLKHGFRPIPFYTLARSFPNSLLPYLAIAHSGHMYEQADEIEQATLLWADEASVREFEYQLRFRLDFVGPPPDQPLGDMYFPADIFTYRYDEVFVDCGAFDGCTINNFLSRRGQKFRRIEAFEPDPISSVKLASYVASLPEDVRCRIKIHSEAVGQHRSRVKFDASGNTWSMISPEGNIEVDVCRLDDVPWEFPPSFLKMDVEGAEIPALRGAAGIILEHEPVLAICLYHRPGDLWKVPLLINKINPRYRFYLRRYNVEFWDEVCYAVPPNRVQGV